MCGASGMGWRRRGAAGVKKGRAGDCGGIGIPATSPVIPGGRCAEPGRKGEKRVLTRGPRRSVGYGAGSLACGPGKRRGVTGDAGDAGDADVRAQMAGGCSARGKGESLGCCVTWTGGAGRGAGWWRARAG